MSVYLVRPAAGVDAGSWQAADEMRPLSGGGHDQARGVVVLLEDESVERIISSPRARCLQTVAPLADTRGLDVEQADVLDREHGTMAETMTFLRACAYADVVCCAHGPLIDEVLEHLDDEGLEHEQELRSDAGSVWVLEADSDGFTTGHYLSPLEVEEQDGEQTGSVRGSQGSEAPPSGGATAGRPPSLD